MKKTKLTRSLLAACSIVALSVVVYGCDSGPSQSEYDDLKSQSDDNAAAAAAAEEAAAQAQAAADAAAAAQAAAEAQAAAAAAAQAAAEQQAAADAALRQAAEARAAAAEEATAAAQAAADAAEQTAADAQAAATAAMEAAAAAQAAADAAMAAQMAAEERAKMAEMGQDMTQGELDARDAAAASAKAAALKAALGAMPLDNLTPLAADQPTGVATGSAVVPSLTPNGLMLGMSARAADGSPNTADLTAATTAGTVTGAARTPRMAPGDAAGMLGDWDGTDYAHTSALTGVSNSARAYRNRTDAVMIPFAAGATFGADEGAFDTAYTRATRTLALGADLAANFNIAGDRFPTAGQIAYTGTTGVPSVVIPGTYQGAPGDYYCSGTACTATASAAGIALGGTWHFVHDEGAMVTHPDPNYLYFGWWLQMDGTGTPANVGAFTGMAGTASFATADLSTAVAGSATYAGPAAGKFAISNPIGADDAGHFTADAMLTATFGANAAPNNGGVSGTLDNFMANEEAVDWEVALLRTIWTGTTGATTTPADDPATALDETMGTIWSVGGSAAAESGSWSAQFYDEAQGAADDGSNVPTSATGTFQSHFGAFMTMVGAFGVERTE